ncbi:MAG: hypothetical protein AB2693_33125, partial [Candidatus Thiodiazotropha sp.]
HSAGHISCRHQVNEPVTPQNKQCALNSVTSKENVPPSTENIEMQIDEPCSPSIIASANVIEPASAASAETGVNNRPQSRGRSATRKAKADAMQKRAESALSRIRDRRSLTREKSKKDEPNTQKPKKQTSQTENPKSQPAQDNSPPPDDDSLLPTQMPESDNSSQQ